MSAMFRAGSFNLSNVAEEKSSNDPGKVGQNVNEASLRVVHGSEDL